MAEVIRLSPVGWQHINLIGIYEFYSNKECLNLHGLMVNAPRTTPTAAL